MKSIGMFLLGVFTTLTIIFGAIIYNTVGVYTTTKVIYDPGAIVSMFGEYSETTMNEVAETIDLND